MAVEALGNGAVTDRSTAPRPRREWLTIHEASELIGVSPATLRRWSDAGEIKAFTTPGGHRRFARAAVLALIPVERRGGGQEPFGDVAERIGRSYRRGMRTGSGSTPWLRTLDDGAAGQFRDLSRRMTAELIDHFDGGTDDVRSAALARAEADAAAIGAISAAHGATIGEALEAFLGMRNPFVRELSASARRRDLDASQTTALLEACIEALDRLLGAVVRGHQSCQPVERPATDRAAASDRPSRATIGIAAS